MIKKKDLSQEDKKVWENFIKDPFDVYDKDIKDQKREIRKIGMLWLVGKGSFRKKGAWAGFSLQRKKKI